MSNADKIAKLRAEADQLEAEDTRFNLLPEDQRIAIKLHKMLCRDNHVDGCGWDYESTNSGTVDWDGHAHRRYLKKSQKIIRECNAHSVAADFAIQLIEVVNS